MQDFTLYKDAESLLCGLYVLHQRRREAIERLHCTLYILLGNRQFVVQKGMRGPVAPGYKRKSCIISSVVK